MADIDLEAISNEVQNSVDAMTPEQLEEELLKIRVRQKVQQKKYQNPERQKAYQEKQKALRNALKARAVELGVYDSINEKAGELADQKIAEEEADKTEAEE